MQPLARLSFGFMLALSACAPSVQDRAFTPGKTSFGPRLQDPDLSEGLRAADLKPVTMTWQENVPTEAYFEGSQNLVRLGELTQQPALQQKGIGWIQKFYSGEKTTSMIPFAETPYTTLAGVQTQEDVQKSLHGTQGDLNDARSLLKKKILALGKAWSPASSTDSLSDVLASGETFTAQLTRALPTLGLPELIADGVKSELTAQSKVLFQELRRTLQKISKANQFSSAVATVAELAGRYQSSVSASLTKSLKQGKKIGQELDALQTPQQALTVLIDLWLMLDPDQREQNFKAQNSSLYDFLVKQTDSDLACLRVDGCSHGLFQGIAKKVFVLPQLQNYGVDKIQSQLNDSCLQNLRGQVEAGIRDVIRQLPQTYAEQIDRGLQEKSQQLGKIQSDYQDFLKGLVGQWAGKILPDSTGRIPGFEAASVKVDLAPGTSGKVAATGDPLDLRAKTAGASMAANSVLLRSAAAGDSLSLTLALAQVNKLIAIGGYRDETQKLVPGLLSPVEKVKKPLDLMNLEEASVSYGIPDKIKLADSFHVAEETPYVRNFSADAFALQIEGLSQMLNYTADWKNTGFENILGKIQAQELAPTVSSAALARPLFPKDMLFALNVADAAVLLEDIAKAATPVFLISLNNQIVWADQNDSLKNDSAIMAGIVDIQDGQRLNTVRVRSEARFLIAIADFLKATDGVKATQSALLLAKNGDGVSPLDSLIQGRKDLKLLVVALANFISNQFMGDQALVQGVYYLHQLQRSNSPDYRAADQTAAIQALLNAWEITGIDAYLWSAEEIYFAMNKNLFDPERGFYVNSDHSDLTFPEKMEALRTLWELKPHLPDQSQVQLAAITAPWIAALQGLP